MDTKRSKMLARLQKTHDRFDRYTEMGPMSELIHFRPEIADAWTIQEHLVHLSDTEVILFLRIRRAIAEPGIAVPDLGPFIRGEWVEPLRYSDQSTDDTVEAFKRIRSLTHSLLLSMAEDDWEKYYITRENGEKPTLDGMLKLLNFHDKFHIDLIERNEKLWQER
jgi:hypothetical protein